MLTVLLPLFEPGALVNSKTSKVYPYSVQPGLKWSVQIGAYTILLSNRLTM